MDTPLLAPLALKLAPSLAQRLRLPLSALPAPALLFVLLVRPSTPSETSPEPPEPRLVLLAPPTAILALPLEFALNVPLVTMSRP